MKTLKHILSISQLLIFLAFVAVGSIQGILQSEKNADPDHHHLSVQHKQNTNLEQGVFEIDIEKESEGGKLLKHASGLCSTQTFLAHPNSQACKAIKQIPQTLLHSRPIFLELHTFRI